MRLYLDASGLVKLILPEEGSDDVVVLCANARRIVTVSLAYVEARSAIARRLSESRRRDARRRLVARWRSLETIVVDDALVHSAGRIADTHRLRALDAIHLAAARRIGDRTVVIATWDAELARAAHDAGFATAPA